MTKYLLLRDNKESGPYTFDDLKAKGLKAYDLVWVEGKSAAWRYPSEVEELKSFAPAVEEQPFDRFYKRPSQGQPNIASAPAGSATVQFKPSSPVLSTEPSAVPGKRIIYVTLPAGKSASSGSNTAPRETIKTPVAVSVPTSSYNSSYTPAASRPMEERSAQTQEELITPVEIMPRSRRNRSSVLQPLAVAACVLALLAAGIFIGLSINKDNFSLSQKVIAEKEPVNPPPPVRHNTGDLPASSATPAQQGLASDPDSTNKALLTATETASVIPKKPASVSKEKLIPTTQKTSTAPAIKDSALIGLPVARREAVRRTEQPVDKVDKDVLRNNLSNLISVGTNTYSVGAFGGITGVQLTVSNKSVYPLDLVVVEVQYIQANKKVFKTENLYFRGIGPGSALMQEAPNSSRGIKVQYKVTLVNSKELGLSYSAL